MNRKAIEQRKYNRWQLANDRRDFAPTIQELSSDCKGVELDITLSFISAFGKSEENIKVLLDPDKKAYWFRECLNGDCTGRGFSLTDEIYLAVMSKRILEGTLRCDGKEDWKYVDHNGFSCPSECHYRIVPLF